jgi:hypothetical protein
MKNRFFFISFLFACMSIVSCDEKVTLPKSDERELRFKSDISIMMNDWTACSMPADFQWWAIVNRSRAYWYNDYNLTAIQEIWPNEEIPANEWNAIKCLYLDCRTIDVELPDSLVASSNGPWNGIMTCLPEDIQRSISLSRYLEMTINGSEGIFAYRHWPNF